ncbi:hypothetical protein [Thiomicrorhabdus sp.]|uniref:hypothetical protein n=1 Tax=Thiomicrorhabdus sp. TaxID=2039724 RepID=UPI00356542C9
MSVIEDIKYKAMVRVNSKWISHPSSKTIDKFPHIFFKNGEPFREVNHWALDKFHGSNGNSLKTITRLMRHINSYVNWLEEHDLHWKQFPKQKKERCLLIYRGYLMDQIRSGRMQCTTAKANMASVIQFYRYAQVENLIETNQPLWQDKTQILHFHNSVGFNRTMSVTSSELSIPCRRQGGLTVEGGLLPLTTENREVLLNFLKMHEMQELYLMLLLGFFVGLRSETIRTLNIEVLENYYEDPQTPNFVRINVGPGTRVRTKYDVSGQVLMPEALRQALIDYYYSERALFRRVNAVSENKELIFITKMGNPYSENSFTKLISDLRNKMAQKGLSQFKNFKFHQSRATYGTMMMTIALENLSHTNAIAIVQDAMLHKHERTTWQYIKFLEQKSVKEVFFDEFFLAFTGQHKDTNELIAQLVNYEQ